MPLPDELKQLAKRVSNWGRWGDDDQRGTLNFITPEAARRGVAAVRRGVLLDIARLKGVEYFEDSYAIGGDDLAAAEQHAGLAVESGDVLLVRTGQMEWLRRGDRQRFADPSPGLGVGAIEYLHDKQVAAVATDTLVFEVWPSEDPAALLPVHMIDLRDMGLVQGQLWHLDELAADCAADGVYEFLLAATPLPITHAVGGPVAPTATK